MSYSKSFTRTGASTGRWSSSRNTHEYNLARAIYREHYQGFIPPTPPMRMGVKEVQSYLRRFKGRYPAKYAMHKAKFRLGIGTGNNAGADSAG